MNVDILWAKLRMLKLRLLNDRVSTNQVDSKNRTVNIFFLNVLFKTLQHLSVFKMTIKNYSRRYGARKRS